MSVKRSLLEVGFDKDGHFDFGVNCSLYDLSYDQMNELRAMVTVAIGTMEGMWRRHLDAALQSAEEIKQ